MLDLKKPIVAEWDVRPATVLARNNGSVSGLPITADALVNADTPYIAKSNHRVVAAEGFPATLTMTVDRNRVVSLLGRGMAVANAQELFSDDRLRTAVELHSQAYQERSPEAVLLMRAMVLGVLAPPTLQHAVALRFIERWQLELVAGMAELDASSDEHHALESLQRELTVRREASVRSRLRSFVLGVLGPSSDAKTIASKVVKAYDRRSTLVHEGRIEHHLAATSGDDLRQAAEQVVEMLLFGAPQEATI